MQVQQTLPEQLQIFLEQVLHQVNQLQFLLEPVELLVHQPDQLKQMQFPTGQLVQTLVAVVVQLHLEVLSHLEAVAVVETTI